MKINIIILFLVATVIFKVNGQTLNLPLITVNETEVSYATVNEIHFSIIVQSHDKEINIARNKNKEITDAVFEYLEEKKIPKKYIQTKRMRISRNYITNRHSREYDGFNGYQEIYVCLQDIDAYDEILDALLLMKVAEVRGPIFKSSFYEETVKKARLEALRKARVSATEMASALGQKIGKAKLIKNNATSQNNSAYSNNGGGNTNKSGQSSFEIGEIEIVASVQVSFELLD